MSPLIEKISQKIVPVLRKHNVSKAGVFGSVARGDATEKSDIDLLVEIPDDISLMDFVGIKIELEELLGRKVDLVEYGAIKPAIKDSIIREQVEIL